MAVRRIPAVGGLSTEPSALDQPEQLRVADNVLLHRPGIIQPRFGFGDTTGVAARSTAYRPVWMEAFDGDVVVQSYNGSLYRLEKASADVQYTGGVAPPDEGIRGVSSFAQARESLYLTTSTGVKKLTGVGASALASAGVRTDYVDFTSYQLTELIDTDAHQKRGALPTDSAVAYRYCWVSEDANGYVRRSSPSARVVVATLLSTGGPYGVEFDRVYLPSGTVAGDRIEVYRTEHVTPRTDAPGTEYFLTLEYTVTSADVSAGYIERGSLYDARDDDQLGATLYTSPSQGGIVQSNEVPPLANVIANWGGVMWYANTTARRVLDVEVISLNDTNQTNDPLGVHQRTGLNVQLLTGDFSSGSAGVANVTRVSAGQPYGLKIGQYITDANNGPSVAGTRVPALTKILTLTTTIAVDNAALNAGVSTIAMFGNTWTWVAGAPGTDEVQIGASSSASATNLATALNAYNFEEPAIDVSASANVANVIATETVSGLLPVAVVAGGGMTVTYAMTMTANALATAGTVSVTACDFVTVNGVEFFADVAGTLITGVYGGGVTHPQYRLFLVDSGSDGASPQDFNARLANTATGLARAVNAYALIQDTTFGIIGYRDVENTRGVSTGDGVVTFIRQTPDLGSFTFQCAIRPDAFRRRPVSAITSEDTRRRNRIHWSKPNEPEAVPLLNFTDIGSKEHDILALVPLERVLLVFKEDGIWAISGTAPNSWVVDEVDLSKRLLASTCTTVLDGTCFAWTDRGVVAVRESGTQLVSQAIGDQLRELQRLLFRDQNSAKHCFWMGSHRRHGLVILGTATAANLEATINWYVLPVATGRWSRWPIASRCYAYDDAEDRAIHSPEIAAWAALYERSDEDAALSYRDASLSGLAGTVNILTVTIATSAFGGYVPAAGDVLTDGSAVSRRVTSVSSGGGNYSLTMESSGLSGVSFTWSQGYAVTLEWQAQQLPGGGCRWEEMHAHLQLALSAGVTSFPALIGGYSQRDTAASTVTPTITTLDQSSRQSGIVRVGPPRDIVRAAHMYPYWQVKTAGTLWHLAGLDLHLTPATRRVAR